MVSTEEGLEIVEQILGRCLNKVQKHVFEHAWEGQSYQEIARKFDYDPFYIKDIGSKLWQLLSKALGEKVTKQNFKVLLKQYVEQRSREGYRSHRGATYTPSLQHDWGEAPDVSIFFNRSDELAQLERWIVQDRCRFVACLGMGGVGKTALSVKLAQQVQGEFEYLIWRSLRNAPSVQEILATLIEFLSNQQETKLPETTNGQVSQLIKYLRASRCLLVLDNVESVLQGNHPRGYRAGYEGYGQLLRCVAETSHQSCLVLTSREKPIGLDSREGEGLPIRSFRLAGLPQAEAQELLKVEGLAGPADEQAELVQSYRGNPLALKIISTSIQVLFNGNIAEFLEQGVTVFNGIRQLLEQQFSRLSDLEQQVMYWLAINREPVNVGELQSDLVFISTSVLLETLESLRGRSLIERTAEGFTQQPVIMEYTTEEFMAQVCTELTNPVQNSETKNQNFSIPFLRRYALMKATAKDYVRQSQIRVIVEPIVSQAIAQLGSKQLTDQLSQLLRQLRTQNPSTCGYAIGNLINLYSQLQVDLTGFDFSHLPVWQAYLANMKLQQVNFAYADLAKSVFAETFGGVSCVAFSPDGQLLATSDTSGEVQMREIASGKQLQALKADTVWTWSVTFSPDGQLFATAGDDYQVKLWDVETGQCLRLLPGHTNTVNAIAFHPQGQLLASCGDTTVRLWQVNFEHSPRVLEGHQGRVWSVAFSPTGDTLVSGSEDQTLKLWDIDTGACRQTLVGHSQWVKSVTYSPDGQTIASGSFDGMIHLWSASTGQCLRTWQGHPATVTCLAFSPDSRLLASGSYDQTVKVWNLASRQCIKTLREHNNLVWSVAFSPDGQYLASGGDDHATRLWHLKTEQCAKAWKGHTNSILALSLSMDQQLLTTGHEDQTVKLWNPQGQVVKTLRGHTNRVWSVSFAPPQASQSPDEVLLASGSSDRTIKLWNPQTGQCLKTLYGHTSWVWSVAFSPNGHQLASGSYDQTIKLWDVDSSECLNTLDEHTAPVVSVTYSPQGQWLASSGYDTTIKLWDVITGECLQTFRGHGNSVWAVAFSPDGMCLASCSYDQTVKLWDIHTGACLQTLAGHLGPVVSLAFNASGQQLASGSFDQTVKLWELKTGHCLQTCYGHTGLVSALAFQSVGSVTDDHAAKESVAPGQGEILLSGSFDETLRYWDQTTGECLQTLYTPHPYDGMKITGAISLTEAQKATLQALGAVEV